MGELARRRRARDLWISRGHVLAFVSGGLLLTVLAFATGVLVGQDQERQEAPEWTSLVSEVPGDELVELLARVEASADPAGGVAQLTFPQALAGEELAPVLPMAAEVPEERELSVKPDEVELPELDPVPSGAFTVAVGEFSDPVEARALRDHLRESKLEAWMGLQLVDGSRTYRVSVGGFGTSEAAEVALDKVRAVTEASVQPL